EDLEVLAAGGLQPDLDRLGHIAAQEGHAVGGLCVFGIVGEDEHRPLPGAAGDKADIGNGIKAIPTTAQHSTVVSAYSSTRLGRNEVPVIQSIACSAPPRTRPATSWSARAACLRRSA